MRLVVAAPRVPAARQAARHGLRGRLHLAPLLLQQARRSSPTTRRRWCRTLSRSKNARFELRAIRQRTHRVPARSRSAATGVKNRLAAPTVTTARGRSAPAALRPRLVAAAAAAALRRRPSRAPAVACSNLVFRSLRRAHLLSSNRALELRPEGDRALHVAVGVVDELAQLLGRERRAPRAQPVELLLEGREGRRRRVGGGGGLRERGLRGDRDRGGGGGGGGDGGGPQLQLREAVVGRRRRPPNGGAAASASAKARSLKLSTSSRIRVSSWSRHRLSARLVRTSKSDDGYSASSYSTRRRPSLTSVHVSDARPSRRRRWASAAARPARARRRRRRGRTRRRTTTRAPCAARGRRVKLAAGGEHQVGHGPCSASTRRSALCRHATRRRRWWRSRAGEGRTSHGHHQAHHGRAGSQEFWVVNDGLGRRSRLHSETSRRSRTRHAVNDATPIGHLPTRKLAKHHHAGLHTGILLICLGNLCAATGLTLMKSSTVHEARSPSFALALARRLFVSGSAHHRGRRLRARLPPALRRRAVRRTHDRLHAGDLRRPACSTSPSRCATPT